MPVMKKNSTFLVVLLCLFKFGFSQQEEVFKAWEKFSFIPCEKIIYYNDFSMDTVGKLPTGWISNSECAIATDKNFPGIKWFQILPGTTNSTDINIPLNQNVSVEFDLLLSLGSDTLGKLPEIQFYFHSQLPDDVFADYVPGKGGFAVKADNKSLNVYNWLNKDYGNINYEVQTEQLALNRNQRMHVSLLFLKNILVVYLNQELVLEIPGIVPETLTYLDKMSFYVSDVNQNFRLMLSNIVIATGMPDFRSGLNKSGKFYTNGIKFIPESDLMFPESFSVLNEINNVINDNPGSSFKIIAHYNKDDVQSIFEKRAESIKKMLVTFFKTESSRLKTETKQNSSPANLNIKSEVEKAFNRRIEIVRY